AARLHDALPVWTSEIDMSLDNDGSVSGNAGTLAFGGGSNGTASTGPFSLARGTEMDFGGGITSSGQFSLGGGAVVDFTGGNAQLGTGSSFRGAGTVRVEGEVDLAGAIDLPAA